MNRDWKKTNLDEVTESISVGIASAATHAYRDSGVCLLRNLNIKELGIDKSDLLYIDEKFEQKFKNKRLKEGDIITVRTGYPGISAVVPKELEGSQCFTSLIIRPDHSKINSDFLAHYINSTLGKAFVGTAQAGGAQKNINAGKISKMPINLPSLREQKKIASILSLWNQYLLKLDTLIKLQEDFFAGAFPDIVDGISSFPGHKKDQRWKVVDLGDVVTPNLRKITKPEGTYKGLGVRSHCKGTFLKEDVPSEDIALDELFCVKANDLIVSITFAWEGAVAIAKDEDEGALTSHRFPTFEINQNYIAIDYLRYCIRHPKFIHALGLISPGGAGRNRVLKKDEFTKLRIPLPPMETQKEIGKFLRLFETRLELLKRKRLLIEQQRNDLATQILTGDLKVRDN